MTSEAIWAGGECEDRVREGRVQDALSYSSSFKSLCPRLSSAFKLFAFTSLRSTGDNVSMTHLGNVSGGQMRMQGTYS